jgi:tetratricopeptide (TPR) repeat protein
VSDLRAPSSATTQSLVRAWKEVVRAELASQVGDVAVYLHHIEAAVEHFAFEGDVRNSALQRHNIGNAYAQLGAYSRAEAELRSGLEVSEPMRLNVAAPARVNRGFALARLGHIEQAIEVEKSALALCKEQGNRRFEAVANIYLGLIHALDHDLHLAEYVTRQGVDAAADAPPLLALAKASLAGILLMGGERGAEALPLASDAKVMLDRLGGVEEGEALIRLVHMSALAVTGHESEARQAIAEARHRLLMRAERIGSATWQKSFLENVPENARTLAFAIQWLDKDGASAFKPPSRTLVGVGADEDEGGA